MWLKHHVAENEKMRSRTCLYCISDHNYDMIVTDQTVGHPLLPDRLFSQEDELSELQHMYE